MIWYVRFASIVAVIAFLFVSPNEADAGRRHRSRRCTCSPCCSPPCRPTNQTCPQYLISQLTTEWYLYFSNRYEGDCGVDAQPDYAVAGELDPLPRECDHNCIIVARHKSCPSRLSKTRPDWIFEGFPSPLPASYEPRWGMSIQVLGTQYKFLSFKERGLKFEAKVFKLKLPSGKTRYLAVELERNSVPQSAGTISTDTSAFYKGMHSYTLQYNGEEMLFLLDTSG